MNMGKMCDKNEWLRKDDEIMQVMCDEIASLRSEIAHKDAMIAGSKICREAGMPATGENFKAIMDEWRAACVAMANNDVAKLRAENEQLRMELNTIHALENYQCKGCPCKINLRANPNAKSCLGCGTPITTNQPEPAVFPLGAFVLIIETGEVGRIVKKGANGHARICYTVARYGNPLPYICLRENLQPTQPVEGCQSCSAKDGEVHDEGCAFMLAYLNITAASERAAFDNIRTLTEQAVARGMTQPLSDTCPADCHVFNDADSPNAKCLCGATTLPAKTCSPNAHVFTDEFGKCLCGGVTRHRFTQPDCSCAAMANTHDVPHTLGCPWHEVQS